MRARDAEVLVLQARHCRFTMQRGELYRLAIVLGFDEAAARTAAYGAAADRLRALSPNPANAYTAREVMARPDLTNGLALPGLDLAALDDRARACDERGIDPRRVGGWIGDVDEDLLRDRLERLEEMRREHAPSQMVAWALAGRARLERRSGGVSVELAGVAGFGPDLTEATRRWMQAARLALGREPSPAREPGPAVPFRYVRDRA